MIPIAKRIGKDRTSELACIFASSSALTLFFLTHSLDRGANFIMQMGNDLPGGFPQSHTVDFVANV